MKINKRKQANLGLKTLNDPCVRTQAPAHCHSVVRGLPGLSLCRVNTHFSLKWQAAGADMFRAVSFLDTNNVPLSSLRPFRYQRAPLKRTASALVSRRGGGGPAISPGKHVPEEEELFFPSMRAQRFSSLWDPLLAASHPEEHTKAKHALLMLLPSPHPHTEGVFFIERWLQKDNAPPPPPPPRLVTLWLHYTLTGRHTLPDCILQLVVNLSPCKAAGPVLAVVGVFSHRLSLDHSCFFLFSDF